MFSGVFATASAATMVCSSSDLPEPVVPAMRPCGPSLRMSSPNGPSYDSPMTASVDCPPIRHRATIASLVGGSSCSTSSSRLEPGSAESSVSPLMSRSGDSDRASRRHQAAETKSGRTSFSRSAPASSTRNLNRSVRLACSGCCAVLCQAWKEGKPPAACCVCCCWICWAGSYSWAFGSATTYAWHSPGRNRSSASRQMANMDTAGPSRSNRTTPGRDLSLRDPSHTTTMSGSPKDDAACDLFSSAAFLRASRICVSSPMRAPTVSASVPMSALTSCPPEGRECGSQRTQSHDSCAAFSLST